MRDAPYEAINIRDHTRDAYDQIASVWSATTDDDPFNGWLERPALRSLIPAPLAGRTVLDAGCGSGSTCAWLVEQGAEVIGVDLSPRMIDEARARCAGARFIVHDLAEPLPVEPGSLDGITSSLALHYLADWGVPLTSFASSLRPGGWAVISLNHPAAPALPEQEGGYFDTELLSQTWLKAGIEVTQRFWRRPMQAIIDAFADAGFVVERIVETRPGDDALQRWPAELASRAVVPSFIVFRLRLAA